MSQPSQVGHSTGYRIIVHPYRQTDPGPPPGGPWLIRCYTEDGRHVHSAEGGVSLHVGLAEVSRAIARDKASVQKDGAA